MEFERVETPEQAGVNSAVVLEFLELLDSFGVENHSFVILKDGKIAVENYTAPFNSQYAHAGFSVSKGFISTAVGYAIADGKMTLDTPILDYFPEYAEYAKKEPRNARITVRDLLTMTSGKKVSFIKDMTKGNYCDDWIHYRFRKDRRFMYSNDDVYMLAVAVTRIYNMSILDLLEQRLFKPLGIERPFWETTTQGVEAGATGLYMRPMDLAKVSYCYLNDGMWDGQQVIPREWANTAGGYYVDLPPYYNTSKKYGYFFWGDPNGDYRFDGMYGQWAIVLKKYNAVVVFNNSCCCVQKVIDEMWKYFPRAFIEPSDGSKTEALLERFKKNCELTVPKSPRSPLERELDGNTYKMPVYKLIDIFGYPISMIPLVISSTMPQKGKHSMDDLHIRFDSDSMWLSWSEGKEQNTIQIGLNGELKESVATVGTFEYKLLSYGEWVDNRTLKVEVRPIETPAKREMKFVFKKNRLRLKIKSSPDVFDFAFGYLGEVSIKPTKPVRMVMTPFLKILEPNLIAIRKK